MALIPEIDNQLDYDIEDELDEDEIDEIEAEEDELPSKTYKINTNIISIVEDEETEQKVVEADRIVGFVDDLEAIKQEVYHCLGIERGVYDIYDEDYGVEFDQYVGQSFEFLESTIEGTLQDALTYDLRIENVTVTNIEQTDIDSARVSFIVQSIYGDLQMEVDIDV